MCRERWTQVDAVISRHACLVMFGAICALATAALVSHGHPSDPAGTVIRSQPLGALLTPETAYTCPTQSSDCGCDWTKNGTKCGTSDDGSECFCRCCCSFETPGFQCKWKPPAPPAPAPPVPPPPPPPPGVTSPADMIKKMGLGINLGNTLEAPEEGAWAPAAKESFFAAFEEAGFTNVRVPVRWDRHTEQTPPYTIDEAFLSRVEQVLNWSLNRGLVTVVNTHHDDWLDNQTMFAHALPRFEAIWQQIAQRFKHMPETLLFEVFNEPHVMTADQLNTMNAAIHLIIRASNPTRIILLGGLQWMSPSWQVNNPGAMVIPVGDPQLALEIHSYDPPGYAMCGDAIKAKCPQTYWGTPADIAALNVWMDAIAQWSQHYHLPIFYGEFGCTHVQTVATGRDTWYEEHRKAIAKHGFAAAVWDDDGGYRLFDRNANTWDTGVLVALNKTTPNAAQG